MRWAERQGFQTVLYDYQPGEEAGLKSATFAVNGEYAFGLLTSEIGVHRLVRISPFDQAKRRHTSFASVYVSPEIDDSIEVIIKPEELRVDTYRSSGKGGQHVNTTDSAVRITHIPTGLVASCQNERSQHKNRERAMSMLRSKLYEFEMEKKREAHAKIEDSKLDIDFGSQIRSYVLQPYRMIKDHRTKMEVGDVDRVIDGDLEPFIRAYLRMRRGEKQRSTKPVDEGTTRSESRQDAAHGRSNPRVGGAVEPDAVCRQGLALSASPGDDRDPCIPGGPQQGFRRAGAFTLAGWDEASSRAAASDPKTPKEVLDYMISPKNLRPALLPALLANPSVSEEALIEMAPVRDAM